MGANPLFNQMMFYLGQPMGNYQQYRGANDQPQFEQIQEIEEFTGGKLTFGESKYFHHLMSLTKFLEKLSDRHANRGMKFF